MIPVRESMVNHYSTSMFFVQFRLGFRPHRTDLVLTRPDRLGGLADLVLAGPLRWARVQAVPWTQRKDEARPADSGRTSGGKLESAEGFWGGPQERGLVVVKWWSFWDGIC